MFEQMGPKRFACVQGLVGTLALCTGAAIGASGDGTTAIRFTDATAQSGLVFTQVHGPAPKYDTFLGGGAVGDFNNDGFIDVFALGNGGVVDALFINNGDGTFSEDGFNWGVGIVPHYAFGASAADFNNDGYLDLFITSYGSTPGGVRAGEMKLYKNNGPDKHGQWSFTNVAVEAGVNRLYGTDREGTGSAWGDIDLDGDLDLFVGGFHATRPVKRLFRNDGPDNKGVWRFTDITDDAEISSGTQRWNLLVPGLVDLTGDRYPDLLAISDYDTTFYWTNDGDSTFTDQTLSLVPSLRQLDGMGLDYGDINRDGRLDFYASSISWNPVNGPGNKLMIQQEDGSFENAAFESGCFDAEWSWGNIMADLDHDGDLDLVATNGDQLGVNSTPPQAAVIFENLGNGEAFVEVAEDAGLIHWLDGRGVVKFDSDNDGDLDVIIFASGDELRYFRNDLLTADAPSHADAHWVRVVLDTRASDRLAPQGIGSTVYVRAGGEEYLLPVHSGSSHCSSSPIEVHAGLGSASVIDALRVAWADGSFTTLTDLPSDQILRIDAPAHPADTDGSGVVDMNDVGVFVTNYIKRDLAADTNGDWTLDIFDVFVFISDYRDAAGK